MPVDGYAHILGNMALAPNGDLYTADRALPLIYGKLADEKKLKPMLVLKDMVSQRGLAMQPDGRIMYVADREMGITVVDLVGKRAGLLKTPETLNLGGIDGLYLKDNSLFIIQNGISPQRVMRLQLDSSGTVVESVRPLAVAQPDFDFPSFGSIVGADIYYFASSQGIAKTGTEKPVTVLRTPLDAGSDLVQPDVQRFLEQQAEKRKQQQQQEKEN
jgi:sugar lactone lactonase YvrE